MATKEIRKVSRLCRRFFLNDEVMAPTHLDSERNRRAVLRFAPAEGTTAKPIRRHDVGVDGRRWAGTSAATEGTHTGFWACLKREFGLRGQGKVDREIICDYVVVYGFTVSIEIYSRTKIVIHLGQ